MKDILSDIVAHKRVEVAAQKATCPLDMICREIEINTYKTFSLHDALTKDDFGIIAEFKRKSPSKGWIHRDADVREVTTSYRQNGAAVLSVLTDEAFFGGSLADLDAVVEESNIPVLRKDFIVDEYQIYDAKLHRANAILLIAAAITKAECLRFTEIARQLELDVLLELHDEREIEYIIPQHNLIGVNNRNLGSFVTTVDKSFEMAELLPKNAVLVSESGISDPQTVRQLRQVGYRGFLIGENFMKNGTPGESLAEFIQSLQAS